MLDPRSGDTGHPDARTATQRHNSYTYVARWLFLFAQVTEEPSWMWCCYRLSPCISHLQASWLATNFNLISAVRVQRTLPLMLCCSLLQAQFWTRSTFYRGLGSDARCTFVKFPIPPVPKYKTEIPPPGSPFLRQKVEAPQ